jgi:hypothetical protein
MNTNLIVNIFPFIKLNYSNTGYFDQSILKEDKF